MSSGNYDFSDEIAYDLEREYIIKDVGQANVQYYLGSHGDAVDKRIKSALTQAEQLRDGGWCGASIMYSVTAIELTIRNLLVRPLIQGAFLSDDWADLLTGKILGDKTAKDRGLLPKILSLHDINISHLVLPDNRQLWATILDIHEVRNGAVHEGEEVLLKDADDAILCAKALREQVVLPIAKKYGFTLEKTGKWSHIFTDKAQMWFGTQATVSADAA